MGIQTTDDFAFYIHSNVASNLFCNYNQKDVLEVRGDMKKTDAGRNMHKGSILSRVDVLLVGAGMAIAFSLIILRLISYIDSPDASSSEIIANHFQRLCAITPFDFMCR